MRDIQEAQLSVVIVNSRRGLLPVMKATMTVIFRNCMRSKRATCNVI